MSAVLTIWLLAPGALGAGGSIDDPPGAGRLTGSGLMFVPHQGDPPRSLRR